MDQNNQETPKPEPRASSPSSVSICSVNSVRPLEWDSGADIGYQNATQISLSTVERMALANGSANLFNAGYPIAESSPFTKPNNNAVNNTPEIKSLVDYSINDESCNSIQDLVVHTMKSTSKNSKSLEDLRVVRQVNTLNGSSKSRSSQNISSGKYPSSSSVSTIVRQEISRKYLHKSVQVDQELLELDSNNRQSVNYSTYTVKSNKTSDNESMEGGSFEYVPGSEYNCRSRITLSNSDDSSVNTFCTEVVDGVDLVTKYVRNLNISNKKKVLKKVAESLMNNIDKESSSDKISENSLKFETNLLKNNSFAVRVKDRSQLLLDNNMVFKPIEKLASTDEIMSSSSKSLPKYENSSVTSLENQNNSNQTYSKRSNSRTLQSSAFSRSSTSKTTNESNSYAISKTETSSKESPDLYSLKKYLTKERETQLLWIKSGIEQLNNLKKLYESQKILNKDLSEYKKNIPKASTTTSDREKEHNFEHRKPKRLSRPSRPLPKANTYQDNSSPTNITPKPIFNDRVDASNGKLIVKYYEPKPPSLEKDCNCKNCNCCAKNSDNKENIDQKCYDRRKHSKRITPKHPIKKPISYTVLFDKSPYHSEIIKRTTKKSFSKVLYFKGNRNSPVAVNPNFKPLENQDLSLKEYLIRNKPDYVDRAEYRRQCLSEIAQLRELRDKSKNELLSLINSDESNLNTLKNNLPPAPLTVLRIFNDHTLRKQTAKKYQQLPEVQKNKMELKRKENNRKNLIIAKVFTKKLQRRVLKGQVNLSNTTSVISS